MEIKKNITINLSEDDVKQIIVEYVKREGYEVSIKDVHLSIGSRIEGFGMAERPVYYFKGCNVSCKEK